MFFFHVFPGVHSLIRWKGVMYSLLYISLSYTGEFCEYGPILYGITLLHGLCIGIDTVLITRLLALITVQY